MPEYATKGAYFGADHAADRKKEAATKGAYYYGVEQLLADKKKAEDEDKDKKKENDEKARAFTSLDHVDGKDEEEDKKEENDNKAETTPFLTRTEKAWLEIKADRQHPNFDKD